ncbi:MAG: hypothetical protein FWB86_09850 [Treponema sp.]|nr:hypothetical protein [Treponema sp.]MCL2252304.1 hypothetical protein [Treponema sp.]
MAMKDFKSESRVPPGKEDEVVRLYMSFGWELKDKQRVKTQDAQKYAGQSSDLKTSYFENVKGVDFFELTFERDPDRKNYAELVELERQYYVPLPSVPKTVPDPGEKPKMFGKKWVILTLIGLCLSLFPGVIIILWRLISYPSKTSSWKQNKEAFDKSTTPEAIAARTSAEKALSEAKKKRSEALEKAKSLV